MGCCRMTCMGAKVTMELDEKVRRALKQAALNLGRPEREITERALRQYLHLDIVDRLGEKQTQLSEEEASRIGNEELHLARRHRKQRTRTRRR
jgi:predicted transcriptional regulator